MELQKRTATGVLARQTLIKMAVRVALVIFGSTAITYFHVFSILENMATAKIPKPRSTYRIENRDHTGDYSKG